MSLCRLKEETCRFTAAARASREIRVRACPPVITAIAFEPPLPEGVVAKLALNDDAPVPVEDMLRVEPWTEPHSSCGRTIAGFIAKQGLPAQAFIDQSRYDIVNLRFSGGKIPAGTEVVVSGLNLELYDEHGAGTTTVFSCCA
jgi:hypothetical protein